VFGGVFSCSVGTAFMRKAFGRKAVAAKGTHGQCQGVRVVLSRRGFCLVHDDGERAYVSVRTLQASLAKAAALPADERGRDSFGELQQAAATHASAVEQLANKCEAGTLEEAEAAKQIMVLLGPATHHAVSMALTASMADIKLNRARRATIQSRKARPTVPQCGPGPKKRGSVTLDEIAQVSAGAEAVDEAEEAMEPSSKRVSVMKRESSTNLTASLQKVGL